MERRSSSTPIPFRLTRIFGRWFSFVDIQCRRPITTDFATWEVTVQYTDFYTASAYSKALRLFEFLGEALFVWSRAVKTWRPTIECEGISLASSLPGEMNNRKAKEPGMPNYHRALNGKKFCAMCVASNPGEWELSS